MTNSTDSTRSLSETSATAGTSARECFAWRDQRNDRRHPIASGIDRDGRYRRVSGSATVGNSQRCLVIARQRIRMLDDPACECDAVTEIPAVGQRIAVGIQRSRPVERHEHTDFAAVRSARIGRRDSICRSGRAYASGGRCAVSAAMAVVHSQTDCKFTSAGVTVRRAGTCSCSTITEGPGVGQRVAIWIGGPESVEFHDLPNNARGRSAGFRRRYPILRCRRNYLC